MKRIDRRRFLASTALCAAAYHTSASFVRAAQEAKFTFRYMLASSMYGYAPIAELVREVSRIGATAIDLWPMVHGNQREQLDEMGEEEFRKLLRDHQVKLGCLTQYKLGPFALQDEMRLAKRLDCPLIVTNAKGPAKLTGSELKSALLQFLETMKPHFEVARETGITIAIENHVSSLVDSPESLRRLVELARNHPISIAFAPYHLPQEETLLANLLRDVVPLTSLFYAWQHGNGCMTQLPKEEELLQLPGRGPLDFSSMVEVLKACKFQGWTEVFMHPFPRGVPILETTSRVTDEINRSREYLDRIARL
jgi:sugar phosphate isomerase/epimerase